MTKGASLPSKEGIALLKSFEGFRSHAYKPYPTDPWTAGYGTTGHRVNASTVVSLEQATKWLETDCTLLAGQILANLDIPLSQQELDALVILTYNIGLGALLDSKAFKLLYKGNIDGFVVEAFDPKRGFVKVNAIINHGLVNRRAREKQLFLEGVYTYA